MIQRGILEAAKRGPTLLKKAGVGKGLKTKPTAKKAVDKELVQGEFEYPPQMAKMKDQSTSEMLEKFFDIISGKTKLSARSQKQYQQTIDKITKD
jgi:hypothetical protein